MKSRVLLRLCDSATEPKITQKPAKNIKPDTIAGYNGKFEIPSESHGSEPFRSSGIDRSRDTKGYNLPLYCEVDVNATIGYTGREG